MLLVSYAVFNVSLQINAWLPVFIVLDVFAFVGIGMILTRFVKEAQSAAAAANAISFPMMFLSGSFFPIEMMPGFLQTVRQDTASVLRERGAPGIHGICRQHGRAEILRDHRGFCGRGLHPGHNGHQMGRGPVIAKYFLRAITQAPYPRAMTALVAATLAGPHRSHFQVQRLPCSTAFAPGRRLHEVLGRPHAGLPTGGRPLLSHHPPPGTSPRGGPPSFCFRCSRPILLLADAIPVHDRHRPVSRPDRRRGHPR